MRTVEAFQSYLLSEFNFNRVLNMWILKKNYFFIRTEVVNLFPYVILMRRSDGCYMFICGLRILMEHLIWYNNDHRFQQFENIF